MRVIATLLLLIGLVLPCGCAKTPPTLGPQAATEFQNMEIGKSIDLIRDVAQDASKTTPPVLTRDVALKITNWHTSAVKILNARGPQWQNLIKTSLDEVVSNLSAKDQETLKPYVALIKSVLAAL